MENYPLKQPSSVLRRGNYKGTKPDFQGNLRKKGFSGHYEGQEQRLISEFSTAPSSPDQVPP